MPFSGLNHRLKERNVTFEHIGKQPLRLLNEGITCVFVDAHLPFVEGPFYLVIVQGRM